MKSLIALGLVLISMSAWACPGLQITDGWIRQAPPGAHVMAAYANLTNHGDKPLSITAISSPAFGAIEIHQTRIEDGESRMMALDDITIAPHEQTRLAPGGIHLMLFRPRSPQLQAGDKTVLSFRCSKRKPVKAIFPVRAAE